MPYYDYYCPLCGHTELDVVHRVDAKFKIQCPNCEQDLKKALPRTFSFGGKGFVGKIRKTDRDRDS
jgi:putative FmdB family regulatory protein